MDEKLIRAVFVRRPLWDPNSSYHKNGAVMKKVWQEVAAELGMSALKTKTRWKSMKDYYRQELRKVESYERTDCGALKESSWRHFDDMSFLRDFMNGKARNRRRRGNTTKVDNNSDYSVLFECSNLKPDSISDHQSIPSPNLVDYAEDDERYIENSDKKRELEGGNELSALIRANEALIDLERRRLDILEREEAMKEDDDLMFLKSLLPHLKSLPVSRKLAIRKRFQDIICEEVTNQ